MLWIKEAKSYMLWNKKIYLSFYDMRKFTYDIILSEKQNILLISFLQKHKMMLPCKANKHMQLIGVILKYVQLEASTHM